MTLDEMRTFLKSVEGHHLGPLYAVAAGLGLRQSELLGLAWTDGDFDRCTLAVRRSLQRYGGAYHLDDVKSHRSRRTLPLSQPLIDALHAQRTWQLEERLAAGSLWQGEEWNLVFATEVGTPVSGKAVTRAFQKALRAAGLPAKRVHDLRHGAARWALSMGVPLKVVQDILGHSTISITADTYAHIVPALQRDAAQRISDGLWGEDREAISQG